MIQHSNKKQRPQQKYQTTKLLHSTKRLQTQVKQHLKEGLNNKNTTFINEGGIKSQTFWKIRRRILKSHTEPEYDTVTEDDRILTDPNLAKDYTASYFENLYQARDTNPKHETFSQKVSQDIKTWHEQQTNDETPIQPKELKLTINKLRRGKSTGPDNIPNEALIEANQKTIQIYTSVFNNILNSEKIPSDWQLGHITTLYKGKGKKGKCSNERGITVSSNLGKLFERVINERASPLINMSDAQAGVQKG
jgi:hypothetical protein